MEMTIDHKNSKCSKRLVFFEGIKIPKEPDIVNAALKKETSTRAKGRFYLMVTHPTYNISPKHKQRLLNRFLEEHHLAPDGV